jgi:hypothetical protein
MSDLPAPPALDPAIIARVLLHGDLRQLTEAQKVSYYVKVCESVGLNPLTRPFAYIVLNGKEILYALREATEQLRFIHTVSIEVKAREMIEGCYVVTASATMPTGRKDESTGAVPIDHLKGEARANAMMKCETKAKRRVTLSICGLGMLDETEVESIPGVTIPVDLTTGEVLEVPANGKPPVEGYDAFLADMEAKAELGIVPLRQAWRDATPAHRDAMPPEVRERLKAKATAVTAQRSA